MFIAVILGYVLASVLAFCGIINLIVFCCDLHEGMDITIFMQALMTALWPLAASAVLCLLVQIATFLEKLNILVATTPKNQDKIYRKSHGHRTFGCAEDSFTSPMEHDPHVVAGEARTFENHARTHVSHIPAPAPKHTTTPAPATPPHTGHPAPVRHAEAPQHQPSPRTDMPDANTPIVNYSSASKAIQDIKPGTFFHMEPAPMPTPTPAPVETPAPAPDADAAPTDSAAPTGDAPVDAPAAKEEPPAPPTDPSLNFFRTH